MNQEKLSTYFLLFHRYVEVLLSIGRILQQLVPRGCHFVRLFLNLGSGEMTGLDERVATCQDSIDDWLVSLQLNVQLFVVGGEVLRVDEVLSVVGRRHRRFLVLHPLQLAVGVEQELVKLQRVLQHLTPLCHRLLQSVEPEAKFVSA